MRWIIALLAAAICAAPALGAGAQCATSVVSMNFGIYNPVQAAATRVSAPLRVTCWSHSGQQQVSFSIALSSGKGSYAARQMIQGQWRLDYNLYADPARTSVWGNGSGGTIDVRGSLQAIQSGTTQTFTIYGEIPGMQQVPEGSYFDIIVATVSY